MTSVARTNAQSLRAALLWAGEDAAGDGVSAGEIYQLEGVRQQKAEIVVPDSFRGRAEGVIVHRYKDRTPLMIRYHRGFKVTSPERVLVALATALDGEFFEIACEDARRRKLTSLPALQAYITRCEGQRGVGIMRALLAHLDPVHPSRSTLEVKTRRLLVANGLTDFVREFPLTWNGRRYFFDYCFERSRAILEVNGRRWHDDPSDYEADNEKWSVPARLGYRIVFATWDKVTHRPQSLIEEVGATLASPMNAA